MIMSDAERQEALGHLDALVRIRAATAAQLREDAKAARKAGDQARASAQAREAIRLNQQNLRILHVQRKLRTEVAVNATLQKMRTIASDARAVEEQIRSGAELLGQARTLVQIIVRLSSLFA